MNPARLNPARLILVLLLVLAPAARAETVRFATYDSSLGRKGPGLMLRDLRMADDEQAEAALAVIAAADADVILLADVDWDYDGAGLDALVARLAAMGADYPHRLALAPVSGTPSGFDLDGDGSDHEARDALGYGWFTGDSGLALLSRLPLGPATDLSGTLWAGRADTDGLLPPGAEAVVPLATTAQWVVPVRAGAAEIALVTMAAGTPVFDGPEDRNGRRNAAELAFVAELAAGAAMPLVMGRANLDPDRGEGLREAIAALLDHPALADPVPRGPTGGTETVEWESVGRMRVDYVLPSRALAVADAGVLWPEDGTELAGAVAAAGPGRLVWVDLALP